MKLFNLDAKPNVAAIVGGYMYVYFGEEAIQTTDPETGEEKTVWNCSYVTVLVMANYGDIVSAVICDRYTMNDQYAILANHASNPDGTKAEYEAFQAWRAEAKRIAKAALEFVNGGGQ